jgi:hypothetical protein
MKDRREKEESCGLAEDRSVLAGCGKTISAPQSLDGLHVWDKPGLFGYLVDLVCFVYLVDLAHLVSFVQPNNQTDQMNKTGWRTFSASC